MIYEAPESVMEIMESDAASASRGGPIILPDEDLNG